MAAIELKVPDIGDFKDIEIIEVLVAAGDTVAAEQSLVTVESDKASMEIPSSAAGRIAEMRVRVGDKVSEGTVLALLETDSAGGGAGDAGAKGSTPAPAPAPAATPAPAPAPAPAKSAAPSPSRPAGAAVTARPESLTGSPTLVEVPDIGDFQDVEVIEVLVSVGDTVALEQSLLTVESDKASMEIPSPAAGVVQEIRVKVGDKVSKGSAIAVVAQAGARTASTPERNETDAEPPGKVPSVEQKEPSGGSAGAGPRDAGADVGADAGQRDAERSREHPVPPPEPDTGPEASAAKPHASPSVRKFARELGVDLGNVTGTGPKQRITHDDVRGFVKSAIGRAGATPQPAPQADGGGAGLGLLPWPKIDFSKFGPIEARPLPRIRKIAAANLHRNWVMIPHVTNQDEADVGDLEALRVQLNKENEKGGGPKLTMLAFLIKACVHALKKFPEFNASLDGDTLVFKHYFHIGFAADTPNGLVVPVVRDADRKGLFDIAQETAELARKARDGKLSPTDMQGGCFSISSLGGIGGTGFTPIINAPEVAILGVSRSIMRPVWDGKQFVPRLMLPLSLSYDHRVIDGAAAARFNAHLVQLLADFRRVLL